MHIEPVDTRSAAEAVRLQLIALIESHTWAIGDRLPSEAELSKAFRVSRTVVREALHSLRALGMTVSVAGKGTFVIATRVQSQLFSDSHLIPHLNEMRVSLEVPAARLAALRRDEAGLEGLTELARAFQAATEPSERVKIDSAFHVAIARCTANPLFVRLIDEIRAVLEEEALAISVVPNRAAEAAAEHMEILAAVAAGDPDRAEAAVRAHLQNVDVIWSAMADGAASVSAPDDRAGGAIRAGSGGRAVRLADAVGGSAAPGEPNGSGKVGPNGCQAAPLPPD